MKNLVPENDLPCIIIGAGGHSKVLVSTLKAMNKEILFITDNDMALSETKLLGVPVVGDDACIFSHSPESVELYLGVGTSNGCNHRKSIWNNFLQSGYNAGIAVHPSAIISEDVIIDHGAQVMAQATIQPGSHIEAFSIVNTGSQIDHDCTVGTFSHIGPGAVLCGDVSINDAAFIGAGATVIPGLTIGADSIIAAGSVVVKNIPASTKVGGIPAKALR